VSGRQLSDVDRIGPAAIKKLNAANIFTVEDLANHNPLDLNKIEGIGIKSALKWIANAKRLLYNVNGKDVNSDEASFKPTEVSLKEIYVDLKRFLDKINSLERRVEKLEEQLLDSTNETIPAASIENPYIRNEELLYDIVREKINDMFKGKQKIQKVSINDLYEHIIKEYSITKEIFCEYMLMLHNRKKIQLEPGVVDEGINVRDEYGNFFTFVRL
jgi:RecG-like helicase